MAKLVSFKESLKEAKRKEKNKRQETRNKFKSQTFAFLINTGNNNKFLTVYKHPQDSQALKNLWLK